MTPIGQQIIAGTVIAIVSWILGYGYSQTRLGQKVEAKLAAQDLNIQRNEAETNRLRDELAEWRKDASARILAVATLVGTTIEHANKVIGLVEVQNQLLKRTLN